MKKWVITWYKDINKDDKTVTLFINTKENVSSQKQVQEEASALENKLGHIEACQAAEEYGKSNILTALNCTICQVCTDMQ